MAGLERVVLSGPLSGRSTFRLVIEGDWEMVECERLVQFLKLMHANAEQDEGHLLDLPGDQRTRITVPTE